MGARLILWALVLIVFLALYGGLILKASNELKSYRANLHGLTASDDPKSTVFHDRAFATGGQRNNG